MLTKREEVLFKYSNFLREVVIRDIKKKYYKSLLGVFWTILNPLLTMMVITIVFSTLFKNNIENFPVYYLCGALIFNFNAGATSQAVFCFIQNGNLIKKMYIPKYMFCLSTVITNFVTLIFSLSALVIVIIITGHKLTYTVLLLPILLIYVFMFTTGLSLTLSTYGVFFRDLGYLYEIFLLLWTYLTPLFYPISIIPENFRFFWDLNPMYQYIEMFRDIVYYGVLPTEKTIWIATLYSILMLAFGVISFKEKQEKFIFYI